MRWQEEGRNLWAQDQGHWECDKATSSWAGGTGKVQSRLLLRLHWKEQWVWASGTQGKKGLRVPKSSLSD